jgi:PD-(D/E)XK nuclease superfamily
VTVHREFFFIGVVEITTAQDAAVIGIENKIDAGEQPQQIARYQETGL